MELELVMNDHLRNRSIFSPYFIPNQNVLNVFGEISFFLLQHTALSAMSYKSKIEMMEMLICDWRFIVDSFE